MHQPISLIKVFKPTGDPNEFVWASHPQVPKHMKSTYILGQQAKGIFEPSWEEKPNEQSTYLMARCFVYDGIPSIHRLSSIFLHLCRKCSLALYLADLHFIGVNSLANIVFIEVHAKQKALRTINELAKFYNIFICSDEESKSDATEVTLRDLTVDEYMEVLLVEWGMDWQKLLKLVMQHMQAPPQQAGVKRAGDTSSRGDKKKIRGGIEEGAESSRKEFFGRRGTDFGTQVVIWGPIKCTLCPNSSVILLRSSSHVN